MDDMSARVELTCPTCGCAEFVFESPGPSGEFTDDWLFTCAHCGHAFTHAQLIEENSESINAAVEDMGDDIVKALAKELRGLSGRGWRIR